MNTLTLFLAIATLLAILGLGATALLFARDIPLPGNDRVSLFAPEPDGSQDPAQDDATELDGHQPPPAPAVAMPTDAWVDTQLQPVVLTADDLYRSRHAADTIRPLSDDQRLNYLTRLRNINDGTGALPSGPEMAAMAADPQEEWRHLTPDWREATAGPIPVPQFNVQVGDDHTLILFDGHGHQVRSHRADAR